MGLVLRREATKKFRSNIEIPWWLDKTRWLCSVGLIIHICIYSTFYVFHKSSQIPFWKSFKSFQHIFCWFHSGKQTSKNQLKLFFKRRNHWIPQKTLEDLTGDWPKGSNLSTPSQCCTRIPIWKSQHGEGTISSSPLSNKTSCSDPFVASAETPRTIGAIRHPNSSLAGYKEHRGA